MPFDWNLKDKPNTLPLSKEMKVDDMNKNTTDGDKPSNSGTKPDDYYNVFQQPQPPKINNPDNKPKVNNLGSENDPNKAKCKCTIQ